MLNLILGIEEEERKGERKAGKGRGGGERILWWLVVGGQKGEYQVGILCPLLAQNGICALEYEKPDWQAVA